MDAVSELVRHAADDRKQRDERTVDVPPPEGREFIKGLKKGDQVEIAYTEAFAIEVKPAS